MIKTVRTTAIGEASVTKEGSYVDVKIHPDSKFAIAKMLMALSKSGYESQPGVEPMSELHCTVMYSTATIDPLLAKSVLNPGRKYTAEVTGCDVFGSEEDTLVLLLKSQELTDLHSQLIGIGAAPTYPEYKAHITVQKPVTALFKTRLEKFLKELEEPMEVKLYRERISALADTESPDDPKSAW